MPVIKDQENIEELRKRLYDRGVDSIHFKRKSLSAETFDVSRGWGKRPEAVSDKKTSSENNQLNQADQFNQISQAQTLVTNEVKNSPLENNPDSTFSQNTEADNGTVLTDQKISEDRLLSKPKSAKNKKTSFGFYFILTTLAIMVAAIFVFIYFLFSAPGQISAKNINLEIEAPFAVAGGDKLPLQLVVSNQNDVDIESVSLVLSYPEGARSASDEGKDILEERIPLENIKAGEVKNIPVEVILFGEENEEKEIRARMEYRIASSNSFFQKEASPISVKLNSSPLVLKIEAVEKISSGQEMDVTLTVNSNSSNPLKNILVKANFPNNFSLIRSNPEVDFGQNVWRFDEIAPNKTYEIKIRGLVSGFVDEVSDIKFEIGSVKSDNKYEIASVLSQTKSSFIIEQSFIDVVVLANSKSGSEVSIPGKSASVEISITNTLRESIYDLRVEVEPQGNVFSENKLTIKDGFYNAGTKTIGWESSGASALREVVSGKTVKVNFDLKDLDVNQYNPTFDISVKVFAKRVSESRANEEQIGSGILKVKFSSGITLKNEIAYKSSPFSDSGPIPPVVNKTTNYTVTFEISAGANDLENGVLSTSLPPYVDFINKYEGEGKVEFNPVSKQLRWEISKVPANERKQLQFQVSVLPTITQVGKGFDVIGMQTLTITDSFTGAELSARGNAIRNRLSSELGFGGRNDIVQPE